MLGLSAPSGVVTISGLSSGADFAVQFAVAHSSIISGAAVFAGQPFSCAIHRFQNSPVTAYSDPSVPFCDACGPGSTLVYDQCKNVLAGRTNHTELVELARSLESVGAIDGLEGVEGMRVWLFRGQLDRTYLPGSMDAVAGFFADLGASVDASGIDTVPSQHAWPTVSSGVQCGETGPIEACGVDGPGLALQSLYNGTLSPPSPSFLPENLSPFPQSAFRGPTPVLTQLADHGMLYVPTGCRGRVHQCDLHVALHGCSVDLYYDQAVRKLSFNSWGEANNIVVLWPRLAPRKDGQATVQQQIGCWDAYGQTSRLYATKQGPQVKAVRAMIDSLIGDAPK